MEPRSTVHDNVDKFIDIVAVYNVTKSGYVSAKNEKVCIWRRVNMKCITLGMCIGFLCTISIQMLFNQCGYTESIMIVLVQLLPNIRLILVEPAHTKEAQYSMPPSVEIVITTCIDIFQNDDF